MRTGQRGNPGRFGRDESGGLPIRMALAFGAIAVAGALLAPSLLQDAGRIHAGNEVFGIDRTVTGSVAAAGRYTVRRSVLSSEPEIVCGRAPAPACSR